MIQVRNLSLRFADGTQALKGIDLDIPEGEFLLICGENGSGKTTLLRLLAGLIRPSAGSIRIFALDPFRDARLLRHRIGIVFQDADSQIVGETVGEDVAFGPENLGLPAEEIRRRVEKALLMTGLRHLSEKPCHLLSGGEKKRLALAGVMALEPEILLFDEPFANLDYRGVREILSFMIRRHQEGRTLILTTHEVEKVSPHVDRIVVMQQGAIKASGRPEELFPLLSRFGVRPPCYALLEKEPLLWLE